MAGNWYFARDKQKLGPFTWNQLRQLAAFGLLQRADHVLEEGTPRWREAAAVEGLFASDAPQREFRLTIAGQNYGPYTTEQIRVFLLAGRLSTTTLAHARDMAKWLPIGDIPEFTAYVPRSTDYHPLLMAGPNQQLTKEEAELHLAGKRGDGMARLISRLMDLKRQYASNNTLAESLDRNIRQLLVLREQRGPWTVAPARAGPAVSG
jgi:hypothetical protein